jgi:hypothetical protein
MAHVVEPELLLTPTPRPVRHRDRVERGCTMGCLQLFILPHTLAGLFSIGKLAASVYFYVAVSAAGVEVDGRVTKKTEWPGKRGPYYTLDYVFPFDGQQYAGEAYVSAEVYAGHAVGDTLPLRVYSPTPREARWHLLPGHSASSDVAGLAFWCLIWNGFLGAMYWFMYVYPGRERRLVRDGAVAVGHVLSVTSWQEKSHPAYKVRYEFDTAFPGERAVTGSHSVRYPLSAADVQVGGTLTVLYDPRKPRRNLLYRFANYRVAVEQ